MSGDPINIFWFRRDLRLDDNTGPYKALEDDLPVLCIFIFDKHILDDLEEDDARVTFIHHELTKINQSLQEKNSTLLTYHDTPKHVFRNILENFNIKKVYCNRDYEPYARDRDNKVKKLLNEHDVEFLTTKDHVIIEPDEVLKDNGEPYMVFTPYSKQWLKKLSDKHLEDVPSALYFDNFKTQAFEEIISLEQMGFKESSLDFPSKTLTEHVLKNYKDQRDYPAAQGTSRLGIHYRFGTISIRKKARKAQQKSKTYLNELIWREFYQMILWHFPRVVNENFKTKYNALQWRNNEDEFEAWCAGKTGYPIVDAGMRQLNKTGYMHNRVRMIVASFLTKHLLIDWRWGEAYFAKKLLDYELASNNGGWQWAAGTGTDAQPYFRIFNPESQTKKFDPENKYIEKWVSELGTADYPEPMVEHKKARERALETFKKALAQ